MDFSNVKNGAPVQFTALITRIEERRSQNGSYYFDIEFTDKTKKVPAKMWESKKFQASNPDLYNKLLSENGMIVKVSGIRKDFNGKLQIIVNRMEIDKEASLSDFLPSSERDLSEMKKEFEEILASFKDENIKKLITAIFDDKMKEKFFIAPAAKGFHHNYISGLLEHTLQMCKIGDAVAKLYPDTMINRDILIAGLLLHDIGKVVEYQNDNGTISLTTEGKLIGHIVIGAELVGKKSEELNIDKNIELKLKHIILAHHGEREFGAAVLPMTIEAFLVHMIDNIDAKMRKFMDLKGDAMEGDEWTERQLMFQNVELYLQ